MNEVFQSIISVCNQALDNADVLADPAVIESVLRKALEDVILISEGMIQEDD
jgi:hypothetical protein